MSKDTVSRVYNNGTPKENWKSLNTCTWYATFENLDTAFRAHSWNQKTMTCIQTTAQETSFQRTQKSPTRLNNQQRVYICNFSLHLRQRPYHVENTGSRPITEVKQRRARLVLGWVTAWEHWVLLVSLFAHFSPYVLQSVVGGCNAIGHLFWTFQSEPKRLIKTHFPSICHQRPYHVEHTSSRPITEVKQHWA